MRASDLLGREVRDHNDDFLGHVTDIEAILDATCAGSAPVPRVTALVLSRRRVGTFLGYQQPEQRGPWLIGGLVRWLHRHNTVVGWSRVASYDGDHITLHPITGNSPASRG